MANNTKGDNTKHPTTIDTIMSNLWLLMGVAGGIGVFIISGNLGTIVYGVALGLSVGFVLFKDK